MVQKPDLLLFVCINTFPATWNHSLYHFSCAIKQMPCPVCLCRAAAVSRSAALRAGALLLLQSAAAGWGKRTSLRRGQELPALALIGQHCQAGAQGRWEMPLTFTTRIIVRPFGFQYVPCWREVERVEVWSAYCVSDLLACPCWLEGGM